MNPLSVKNQSKALDVIISLCDQDSYGVITQPRNFEDHFPFLQQDQLRKILQILNDKELISLTPSQNKETFFIADLTVTAKGLNYKPQASYDNCQKWKELLWGFLTGSVFTAIISVLIQVLSRSR